MVNMRPAVSVTVDPYSSQTVLQRYEIPATCLYK